MKIRYSGYCQVLKREVDLEIEYIETTDLSSTAKTFKKGLATCYERKNHGADECKGCRAASNAPDVISKH